MRTASEQVVAASLAARSGGVPRVVAGGNFNAPMQLLALADKAVPRFRLFMLNAQQGIPVRDGIVHETPFVGPGMRGLPSLVYLPMRLSLVPAAFGSVWAPDIVLVRTSTPVGGKVSLGIEVDILPAAIEQARARGGLVVAQLDPGMPYTYGDSEIDVDLIDLGLEVEQPLPVHVSAPGDAASARIAEHVSAFVADGATVQTGIGRVPDAVVAQLRHRRGLRIWSEMISDGVLRLEQAMALDPQTPIVASFLFGTPELYAWADRNPWLRMLRTETVNNPARIAGQPMMTSINTALQVDLAAQANASYAHGRIYSGFGGQPDFVVGALHAPGGHAVIALASRHKRTGAPGIVDRLDTPVTSMQHTAVVTEQGSAAVFGLDQQAQAERIIDAAAHPDDREILREAARRRRVL